MSELADREWRLIRDEPREGAVQMALEEVAAKTALEDDLRTVRVYSWEPSTLSLGYRQDADTVDWAYCDREGIDVTRRQTGGGGIYHDRTADISYTIVAPAAEVPSDLMDCYELFCEPILEGLERMGVDAAFASVEQASIYQPSCYLRDINPAHDVVAPAAASGDTRKISGNAQYRQRDVVIQHGSISYDRKPDHHVGVFDADLEPEIVTDRVTSVREEAGIDREDAVDTLATALGEWCTAEAGSWREDELAAADDLADRKFGADAWIRDREILEAGEQ
ncbi:biotin/lipoate A/B protein ligase family protein [Natronolimnohabitans sp. A-GB9]|uniref:lipoate--protein ligase family protein n=1 Tax=Natronolimnohabitans sp. A-GB9 TaxID=3069757 RepID=UPI0027B85DC3|nr:biotin/lipoate A/B protein ligase family protein [Natronolimnohabitans sp. A-GB9]MDQ2051279.1 biotin/lipoate A/B protein ligase family protein [Natronolimnohabitans sp. A-GB9]